MREQAPRLGRSTWLWRRLDFVLFRSIFAGLVACLLILCVVAGKSGDFVLMSLVFVLVVLTSRVFLFPERTFSRWKTYPQRVAAARASVTSYFQAWLMIAGANHLKRMRLQNLVRELESESHFLTGPRRSAILDNLSGKMAVLMIGGDEDPLPGITFVYSIQSIGFEARFCAEFSDPIVGWISEKLRTQSVERVAIVVSMAVDSPNIVRFTSSLIYRYGPLRVSVIPLYVIARTGLALLPETELHDLPTEAYLRLKSYLERAASLATIPPEGEVEHRGAPAPPLLR